MKVRIIKNLFPQNAICELNLSNYIGQELYVDSKSDIEGSLNVIFPHDIGTVTVYKSEYEIIEVKEDLENYFRNNQRRYNFCNEDVIDFLMGHRDEIVNILR